MPKTNIKGGKKKKRGKNGLVENLKIIFIEDDDNFQLYGQVSKILGNGSFLVSCFKKIDDDFKMEEKLCLIRGKMRKRNWININDIVVVSVREFEKHKADIVHKYSNDEARILKLNNKIPNIDINDKKGENEDVNFSFNTYEDSENTKADNSNSYYNFSDWSDEEEKEQEFIDAI